MIMNPANSELCLESLVSSCLGESPGHRYGESVGIQVLPEGSKVSTYECQAMSKSTQPAHHTHPTASPKCVPFHLVLSPCPSLIPAPEFAHCFLGFLPLPKLQNMVVLFKLLF